MTATRSFEFRWDPRYRRLARIFGVRPERARVEVGDGRLTALFGPWRVRTPVANVVGCCTTGPYRMAKTMGPARLSLVDRGVTFATNGELGLCILFATPVRGIDPTGVLRHPGLTVTVADPDGLRTAIEAEQGSARGPDP